MSILGTIASLLPIQVPLINGVVYGFPHIEMRIAGLKMTGGFKSLDYERVRTRDDVESNSPDPVAKTLGMNKYKCEAEVYLAWWYALLNTVQAQGTSLKGGYGDIPFAINVSYTAQGFTPFQDTILNCTFDSTQGGMAAGAGALTRKIQFNPTKILFNGLDDLATPLQALPL